MSACRRLLCPVHGVSRAARAHRRAVADQDAANHIAWAASLRQRAPRSLAGRPSRAAWASMLLQSYGGAVPALPPGPLHRSMDTSCGGCGASPYEGCEPDCTRVLV